MGPLTGSPQNTARTITPILAMRPPGEGAHEQNNDNNEHNQSHFHLLRPEARCAALIRYLLLIFI